MMKLQKGMKVEMLIAQDELPGGGKCAEFTVCSRKMQMKPWVPTPPISSTMANLIYTRLNAAGVKVEPYDAYKHRAKVREAATAAHYDLLLKKAPKARAEGPPISIDVRSTSKEDMVEFLDVTGLMAEPISKPMSRKALEDVIIQHLGLGEEE